MKVSQSENNDYRHASATAEPTKIVPLPFDIWLSISILISVKDILSLSHTCKEMYDMMSERAVWSEALRDLLSVIPIPRLSQNFHSMTASELKFEAVQLAHADSAWPEGEVSRDKVTRFPCKDMDVRRVLLLPGGEWILLFSVVGELRLYRWSDLGGPCVCYVEGHTKASHPDFEYNADIHLSSSSTGSIRLMITEACFDGDDSFVVTRIYGIDLKTPYIIPLNHIHADCILEDCDYVSSSCYGNRLALVWQRARDRFLISVQTLGTSNDVTNKTIIMVDQESIIIGDSIDATLCSATLCSEETLLLAGRTGFHLFHVPLEPAGQVSADPQEPTAPCWSYELPKNTRLCRSPSPVLFEEGNSQPGSHRYIAIMTVPALYLLHIPSDPAHTTFESYGNSNAKKALTKSLSIPHRAVMGFRRAIFATVQRKHKPIIDIKSCAYFTCPNKYENESHIVRLGAPTDSTGLRDSVQIPFGENEDLGDICWDEETRRMCALLIHDGRRGKAILRVDV